MLNIAHRPRAMNARWIHSPILRKEVFLKATMTGQGLSHVETFRFWSIVPPLNQIRNHCFRPETLCGTAPLRVMVTFLSEALKSDPRGALDSDILFLTNASKYRGGIRARTRAAASETLLKHRATLRAAHL